MDFRNSYVQDEFAYTSNQLTLVTFMNRVYAWMTLGLAVTAVTAWTITALNFPVSMPLMIGSIIGSFALVWILALSAHSMPGPVAIGCFILYAVLEGVMFSFIFIVYSYATISLTFFTTAALFGSMALIGTVTKKDLTGLGGLCFMGLLGLILVMIVQMVATWLFGMPLRILDIPISIIGVLIFVGLTAYDAQRIKQMSMAGETSTGLAISGALSLYLDFINLFLFLLRLAAAFSRE